MDYQLTNSNGFRTAYRTRAIKRVLGMAKTAVVSPFLFCHLTLSGPWHGGDFCTICTPKRRQLTFLVPIANFGTSGTFSWSVVQRRYERGTKPARNDVRSSGVSNWYHLVPHSIVLSIVIRTICPEKVFSACSLHYRYVCHMQYCHMDTCGTPARYGLNKTRRASWALVSQSLSLHSLHSLAHTTGVS